MKSEERDRKREFERKREGTKSDMKEKEIIFSLQIFRSKFRKDLEKFFFKVFDKLNFV